MSHDGICFLDNSSNSGSVKSSRNGKTNCELYYKRHLVRWYNLGVSFFDELY